MESASSGLAVTSGRPSSGSQASASSPPTGHSPGQSTSPSNEPHLRLNDETEYPPLTVHNDV